MMRVPVPSHRGVVDSESNYRPKWARCQNSILYFVIITCYVLCTMNTKISIALHRVSQWTEYHNYKSGVLVSRSRPSSFGYEYFTCSPTAIRVKDLRCPMTTHLSWLKVALHVTDAVRRSLILEEVVYQLCHSHRPRTTVHACSRSCLSANVRAWIRVRFRVWVCMSDCLCTRSVRACVIACVCV